MNKNKQLEETFVWLDRLSAACESVILDTDVSLIEPFELVNLINVRLHMEDLKPVVKQSKETVTKKSKKTSNLILFSTPKKDTDDTH